MNGGCINLTDQEREAATAVGSRRHAEAVKKRLPDRHGFRGDSLQIHVEGACGELAAAKALGLPWDGPVNTFKRGGDVGDLQVRTRSNHAWDLIVRPDDRDGDVFVLVTGLTPRFRVHGWIRGVDAKKDAWRKTYGGRPPAYFVPQRALRPLEELATR
jgi:hypothetical protein